MSNVQFSSVQSVSFRSFAAPYNTEPKERQAPVSEGEGFGAEREGEQTKEQPPEKLHKFVESFVLLDLLHGS